MTAGPVNTIAVALLAHPSVADAAVIGTPDDRWGEAVLAVVARRTDATVSDRDLTV